MSARGGRLGDDIPGGADRPGGTIKEALMGMEEVRCEFELVESVESGLTGVDEVCS